MRYLLSQGFTRFIELGPATALSGFMKRIDKGAQMLNVADVASLEATVKALAGSRVRENAANITRALTRRGYKIFRVHLCAFVVKHLQL